MIEMGIKKFVSISDLFRFVMRLTRGFNQMLQADENYFNSSS